MGYTSFLWIIQLNMLLLLHWFVQKNERYTNQNRVQGFEGSSDEFHPV